MNYSKLKRFIDIILSLIGVVILAPLFLVIILAIKADSKGPVLFKQRRVGQYKKHFNILKFRTMDIKTPSNMPTHLLENPDQWITKVGKLLRKTSLDELPQIFNILRGEMSIIGPRPALWNQSDLIAERDRYGVNDIPVGLTGWAQINGRDELPISVKVQYDLDYLKNIGLMMDIKCFFGTIIAVIKKKGYIEGSTKKVIEVVTEETQENDSRTRILITGKNSFVGNSFTQWMNQYAEQYKIDVIDLHGDAWKAYDFSKYDIVFHVAGIAHVSAKPKLDELYLKVNRDLAIETAQKAKEEGVHQFIFMSSIIVYGDIFEQDGRIDINTIPKPKNTYGRSKLEAEVAISKLSCEDFKVVIARPPMIYGANSRGNYHKLSMIAKFTPIFFNYQNIRSMIHIDNFCEFLRIIVDKRLEGIFFPQNAEYVSTYQMVHSIAKNNGNRIYFTKLFNPIISNLMFVGIIQKIFGNLYYESSMSKYLDVDYQILNFEQSIRKSELTRKDVMH